jgi:hypothetical protein
VFVEPSLKTGSGKIATYRVLFQLLHEQGKRITLTGTAGSGKTWLLRKCAIDIAGEVLPVLSSPDGSRQTQANSDLVSGSPRSRKIIPIYVPLRELRLDLPLISAIALSAGLDLGMIHRLLLLFDGLDEVTSLDRLAVIERIRTLDADQQTITSVISARPLESILAAFEPQQTFELQGFYKLRALELLTRAGPEKAESGGFRGANYDSQVLREEASMDAKPIRGFTGTHGALFLLDSFWREVARMFDVARVA